MNKALKYILAFLVVSMLVTGAFAGGFVTGRFFLPPAPGAEPPAFGSPSIPSPLPMAPISTPEASNTATPSDLQTLFKPFWETWQLVHDEYVDQPVDDLALMRGAIRGMLEALGDQHTSYMDPAQYTDATTDLSGEYEGIGAWVDITGEYLTIVSPMTGSPAEKAGIKPGDKIIAIDGEDMTGIDGELVRRKVLGPAGTTVRLTISREGLEEPLDIEVTRARITVPSVESKMLEDNLAYVKLNTFGENTTTELRGQLETLLAQNPDGLILDLRNNGGGYLITAIEVVSEFVGNGVVMYEEYGDGTRQTFEAQPGGLATQIPLVVLVNEGTASASEIVAGAVQDYGRGKLVGVTSFGKGSVQTWIPLSDNQGAVRVTVAKWLTPDGRTIHQLGLTPDVVVEMTPEDYDAGRDPQLDKAVEVMLELVAGGN
ncbi:MAG: S41 family peptidase [Chloroflexota bacterium]